MAYFIIRIIGGGTIGLLASLVMRSDGEQRVLVNIVVGVVGAFIAEIVSTPLFGSRTISQNNFSLPALLVPLLGAICLLTVVSFIRRSLRQQR